MSRKILRKKILNYCLKNTKTVKKNYNSGDSLEKWEWFHKEYPNSELWNEKKLIELSIL